MDYVPVRLSEILPLLAKLPAALSPSTEEPLFWRDAMGGAEISMVAKKDAMGMDFLPVRPAEIAGLLSSLGEESATPQPAKASDGPAGKRILYYRNPMGLPDISPVPKIDGDGLPAGLRRRVRIPMQSGQGFRFEGGRGSDLKPATILK